MKMLRVVMLLGAVGMLATGLLLVPGCDDNDEDYVAPAPSGTGILTGEWEGDVRLSGEKHATFTHYTMSHEGSRVTGGVKWFYGSNPSVKFSGKYNDKSRLLTISYTREQTYYSTEEEFALSDDNSTLSGVDKTHGDIIRQ